jgi:hypothetical protein
MPGERGSLNDALEFCPGFPDRIEFNGFAVIEAPPLKSKSLARELGNTKDEENTCEEQTALATAHSNIAHRIT